MPSNIVLHYIIDMPFEADAMLEDLAFEDSFDKVRFKQQAGAYINSFDTNLHNRFPQAKMLSLLDCLDPKNIGTASRINLMKLGDAMVIDGE